MVFFQLKSRTEAEKAQQEALKELKRVAKTQRKEAAKEHKDTHARMKQEQKEAKQLEREAKEHHRKALKVSKKASKMRIRMARKTEKDRARRLRQQIRRARLQSTVVDVATAPPFAKSTGCYVCGKKFGHTLHRRRHHCRQCRESCCLQCMSRTRRVIAQYGLEKPQKVCVVCETLVFPERPREPAEAVAALATNRGRRPHSAPLPRTDVTVLMPTTRRGHTRSRTSKNGSLWTLPIRPLLKKKSAEQRRNRTMDYSLQLEKQAIFGGPSIELQPQVLTPPAP